MLETCVEPSTVKMVLNMKVTRIFIAKDNIIDLRNRCLLEQSKQKRDCQVLWLQQRGGGEGKRLDGESWSS